MSDKIKIIQDLKQLLEQTFNNKIQDVILFGSRASDRGNDNSDYDILIIYNGIYDYHIEREIIDLCYEIDLQYEIVTDTHILASDELHSIRGKQPIFQSAIENGIYA